MKSRINPWADMPMATPPRAKIERHAFTENYLRNLRARDDRYSVWCADTPGLGMRVYPSGKKTWVAQAVPKGGARQVLVTLGRYPAIRPAAARKLAEEAFAQIARGKNPNVEADQRAADTFRVMCEQYINTELAGLRRGREVATSLRSDWLGQVPQRTRVKRPGGRSSWETVWSDGPARLLRDRPVVMIEKTELLARLDKIRNERGPWAARHAMAAVRAVFGWAAADGRFGLQVSPAAGLRDRTVGLTAQAMRRQRVLTDVEIRAIWQAAAGAGLYGQLVRLVLLTGQRRADWGMAQWSEIDGPLLTVPAERFKTGRSHEVPLAAEVLELLEELPRYRGCPWLFSRDGKRPAQDYGDEKAELLRVSHTKGWHLHDLRRTVRTRLSVLRVPRDVAERVIGHEIGGLDPIYDLSSHLDAKREALTAWAAALRAIVNPPDQPVGIGGNVVALRRAG